MRVGDVYKIQSMIKGGATEAEIVSKFKNGYPLAEIKKFIPKKRKPRKDKGVKRVKKDVKNIDL